jgi:hypothetical protein
MSETEYVANGCCPLPWGEGGPRPALSPAGAGRVRGQLHAEDGSERLGASCSIDTSKASSFWRAERRISLWTFPPTNRRARCFVRRGGLSMTVSGRSPERRSVGPLLSTVRLGQPCAHVLTSRIAVFGYERSARQGGRLPLETARMAPWVIQGFTSTTPSRALRSLLRQADDTFTCL